ncbi:MAG: hypothetical protein HZB54_04350 [Deltaproteobacteria bacterium]|nr:hypothetical protein [Deltaproteobacteria bacterium]
MNKLVATFEIQLPSWLLVQCSEKDDISYNVKIANFEVKMQLIHNGPKTKRKDEKYWTLAISRVRISVSRHEHVKPPPVRITNNIVRGYSVQADYFEERLPEYQKTAVTALNRLILFFKYKLQAPLLNEFDVADECFMNPQWTDEYGKEVGKGMQGDMVPAIIGFSSPKFGIKKMTVSDDEALKRALQTPIVPELFEEILSDAQAAIVQNNLRRGILEMAIVCEIAVKHAFFAKYSTAGAAYEYFEDKGRINISVLELIHGAAKEAFGESFKEFSEKAYKDIVFLFRCRNKIAHRGEITYGDDAGIVHTVDRGEIEKWWVSVEMFLDWLKKHKS